MSAGDTLSVTAVGDMSWLSSWLLCHWCTGLYMRRRFRLNDHEIAYPHRTMPMMFDTDFIEQAIDVRVHRDRHTLGSVISTLCRTPVISISFLSQCLPDRFTHLAPMTCGGMSRVFSAHDTATGDPVVVKVTECSRGCGLYEMSSYKLLASRSLPIAKVYYTAMYENIHIMVMKRYPFTLSSVLLAISQRYVEYQAYLGPLLHNIRYILGRLREERITFSDFSPDNIMVDVREDGSARCILIDPQFATEKAHITRTLGRQWTDHIDRVHFAYKVRTLYMAHRTLEVQCVTGKVCQDLLAHVPSEATIRAWILKVLPQGLRVAYDAIVAEHKRRHR